MADAGCSSPGRLSPEAEIEDQSYPERLSPAAKMGPTTFESWSSAVSRKLLIQMSGAPGSGKSTMANLLAQSINGVVINHDLIKHFFLENNIAFDQSARLTYRLDWVLAEDMIKQGRDVIIDSTCNYNEVLDQGTALARKYNYDYRYIECRVDDVGLLDQRLRNRVSLRSQRTGVNCPPPDASGARDSEDYHALFKRWIEDPCRPAGDVIVVDSTGNPEECLDYLLKRITRLGT